MQATKMVAASMCTTPGHDVLACGRGARASCARVAAASQVRAIARSRRRSAFSKSSRQRSTSSSAFVQRAKIGSADANRAPKAMRNGDARATPLA